MHYTFFLTILIQIPCLNHLFECKRWCFSSKLYYYWWHPIPTLPLSIYMPTYNCPVHKISLFHEIFCPPIRIPGYDIGYDRVAFERVGVERVLWVRCKNHRGGGPYGPLPVRIRVKGRSKLKISTNFTYLPTNFLLKLSKILCLTGEKFASWKNSPKILLTKFV